MTSKCKSFKNLILIAILFVLTLITGVLGTSLANAESGDAATGERKTYIHNIYDYYDKLEESVGEYNGTEVLQSIKSSADYLIGYVSDFTNGDCIIGSVKDDIKVSAIYAEKEKQLKAIEALIENVEEFNEIYDALLRDNYDNIPWDDIEKIKEDFLKEMDILKLFSEGNLNKDYINAKLEEAINKLDGIETKPAPEDLTEFKSQQKTLIEEEYNRFKASNYYSNTVVEKQAEALQKAKADIDEQETRSGIVSIKSSFLSQLRNSITLVEEAYNYYIESITNVEYEPLATDKIADIIDLYGDISSGQAYTLSQSRLAPIKVAHSRLLNVYKDRKLAEVEDIYYKANDKGEKLISRYSKYNSDKISWCIEDARVAVLDKETVADINTVMQTAIDEAAKVPTNVQTIYSQYGDYSVKITALDNAYAFAPTAYVEATNYEYYPVKKNVNRILRRLDAGKSADGKDLKYEVKYYIDFTIIDENGRELEEKSQNYQVEITVGEDIINALGQDYKVIYYYNGVMDGYSKANGVSTLEDKYSSTIETLEGGETVLKFTTTHFSPYALCGKANASGAGLGALPIYQNPFFYLAVLLFAIIVIIFILIALKHWKYKVVFKNNGGTRVKARKFKKTEPILMPKAPTKEGFIFGGWYTNKKLTKRFVQYRVVRRRKIKLWAKWIPLNVEIAKVEDYYQALRAALDDYERIGVQIGLKEEESVARIIISNEKVLLFVCGSVEKYTEMGYSVTLSEDEANKDIPVKFVVANEEDLYKALEIIDIAMKSKGFTDKPGDPEIKEISEEERKDGFIFTFKNEKVADTLKEWFELLRLQAKSFVMVGDSGTPRDLNGKYIVKAKRYDDRIDLYLPVGNENSESVAGDILYKDVPNKFVIKTAEDVPGAIDAIENSMTSLGMKKYPRNASQLKTSADTDTAFGYKIRFN